MNCLGLTHVFAIIIMVGLMANAITDDAVLVKRAVNIATVGAGAWYLIGYLAECRQDSDANTSNNLSEKLVSCII